MNTEYTELAAVPAKNGTEILLEQAAKVEDAKKLKIEELLYEKASIVTKAMDRVEQIKLELKALGYRAPRKKSENSAEKPAQSLDNSAVVG